MDMTEPDAPWRLPRIAAITVVFTVLVAANYAHALLTLIPAYNALHRAGAWYFVELLDNGLVLTLVTIGLMSVMGAGPAGMWRALRLHRGFLSGLLFALVALRAGGDPPNERGLCADASRGPRSQLDSARLYRARFAVVEEIHVRGFGFWQLRNWGAWPFWFAVAP